MKFDSMYIDRVVTGFRVMTTSTAADYHYLLTNSQLHSFQIYQVRTSTSRTKVLLIQVGIELR